MIKLICSIVCKVDLPWLDVEQYQGVDNEILLSCKFVGIPAITCCIFCGSANNISVLLCPNCKLSLHIHLPLYCFANCLACIIPLISYFLYKV